MLKKLLVVPLCFVAGLVLVVSAFMVVTIDFRRHATEFPDVRDIDLWVLGTALFTHRLHVLFIAGVWVLGGIGLWIIALLAALERLPR